jgi:hypothetical protein
LRQFPTTRARTRAIIDLINARLGRTEEEASARICELFLAFPHFWCAAEEDVQLRGRLNVLTYALTGEENTAITLADAIIRDQAGLPQREMDDDPVFDEYRTSSGKTYAEGGTVFTVVGPCPAAGFRHAVVMSTKDSSLKIVCWASIKDRLSGAPNPKEGISTHDN